MKEWLVKLAAIAAIVSAIIAVLKFVLEMSLSSMILVLTALVVLSIAIIALYILFSKVLPQIKIAIKQIGEEGYMTILRAIAATIVAIMVVLVFFTTKRLPTAGTLEKTVKKVGNKIAAKNMASLSSSMDNIIHTIIGYQKDPDATRNRVYEDALRQAADKGYVFYVPQKNYYITAINKRNDESLLTEEEKNRIKNSLDDILKRSEKRDQISLMNMVLSDIRVTEELWMPKDRVDDLSPLDLMTVVGGYIGELILKY